MRKLLWLGLVLSIFLTACGTTVVSDESIEVSVTKRTLSPGTYEVVIGGILNYHVSPPVLARWKLSLDENGFFSAVRDDKVVVSGHYYLERTQIIFMGETASSDCKEYQGWRLSTYQWQFDEDTVVLRPVGEIGCT